MGVAVLKAVRHKCDGGYGKRVPDVGTEAEYEVAGAQRRKLSHRPADAADADSVYEAHQGVCQGDAYHWQAEPEDGWQRLVQEP